jgi:hypothetical protein
LLCCEHRFISKVFAILCSIAEIETNGKQSFLDLGFNR